jgi:PBP1b-binding outer membrane lipoprotein LpoB
MHTDRCGYTCRQKCDAKGSGNEAKLQEFMYRDTTNVEPEMYGYISSNWSHRNSNKRFKEKFGSCTGKTFDRFTTKDSYTWNITHNAECTAVWNLKLERWGSLLVQEKYRGEKACDKRQQQEQQQKQQHNKNSSVIVNQWHLFKTSHHLFFFFNSENTEFSVSQCQYVYSNYIRFLTASVVLLICTGWVLQALWLFKTKWPCGVTKCVYLQKTG